MKKILLIEDNDAIRLNTAEILELANYTVTTADNGKTGVQKAFQDPPDLIICDIMMPEMDGFGVLHTIRKNDATRNTPFIFLTARTDRTDLRRGMDMGADDYLTKPFTADELLMAIQSRLEKAQSLRQEITKDLEGIQELITAAGSRITWQSLQKDRPVNQYKKKQLIYSAGHHPNRFYYIVRGKVKTYKVNEDSKELVTNLYKEGDFFGYIALLEGTVYKDTAKALEDTELAVIPKEEFDRLVDKNPGEAKKLIRLLANHISAKEEHLLNLAYSSLRKKVAEALVFLNEKFNEKNETSFRIDMSRENLANIAGTAKESLTRTLGDFQQEKLIKILKDGSVTLLNPAKLIQLAN